MTRVVDDRAEGRFELREGDAVAGFVLYQRRPGLIALVHTEIEPGFEGRGLGGELARAVLDAARAEGLQVLPYCPFIRGWIEDHPAYVDLVPADQRLPFGLPAASAAD